MKRICHVDKDGDALVVRCDDPGDAGLAFVLLGRLLLRTPHTLNDRQRQLMSDALESLVPADVGPVLMINQRGPEGGS